MTALEALRTLTSTPLDDASPVRLLDCGRKELRLWWKAIGAQNIAEIGVWQGDFARTICEVTGAHLYAVDPWSPQVGYLEVKNKADRLDGAYLAAVANLAPYRHTILRMTSLEAAKQVPDRSLDVAYIDGNHLREHVLADIAAWIPKVKVGGVISGHDFKNHAEKRSIQVVDAVQQYTQNHDVPSWFVFAADKSPSWAWVVA